ncbi:MAG: hypothetical protein H0U23_01945 [Blastocatellia bacterium]|nr:hypothetical protein [Blastocatellia bacterium]
MTTRYAPEGPGREQSGVVLVITLALIALLSVVVVAYFSRTVTNRGIESASSSAARVDILARASAQMILSDIKGEIVAGSTGVGSPAVYRPTDAKYMVPARVLAQNAMLASSDFNSLAKQSVGRFYPSVGYSGTPLITAATATDTTVSSINSRIVSLARWNMPVLNTGSGFTLATQLPHWVIVDRQGIAADQSSWSNTYRDYTPGNDSAVIGRFAFNVYDTGGLLDANVAGYGVARVNPSSPGFAAALTPGDLQQLKSSQSGAYLYDPITRNPIVPTFNQAQQQTFVNQLRFPASGTSSPNYLDDLMSRKTLPTSATGPTYADSGFMRPTVRSGSSNTIAYSRHDLLRATEASAAYLTRDALPYFTHFSRELNAPSWSPTQDASAMGGNTDASYAYRSNRDLAAAINRDVQNVRVQTAFTRADGTQAVAGEPLIKNRFPLRRLEAVTYNGVTTGAFPVMVGGALQLPNATTVQRDFGLVWEPPPNSRWNYVGADSGGIIQPRILTLEEVAQGRVLDAGGAYSSTRVYRDPNFFEVLKAFILSGALGLGSDNSGTGRTFVDAEQQYYQQPLSGDAQIIQIGANIIDQWDGDKNPTIVFFASTECAGVENLPFLNKLLFQPRWDPSTTPPKFRAWIVPSFWAPAQNGTSAGTASTTAPFNIPAVRFIMTSGSVAASLEGPGTFTVTSATLTSNPANAATQSSAQLTAGAPFGPTPDAAASATTTKNLMTGAAATTTTSKLGIELSFGSTAGITKDTTVRAYPAFTNATFEMQARIGGPTGQWKTYQRWTAGQLAGTSVACQPAAGSAFDWTIPTATNQAAIYDPEFVLLDPRTMRFGVWETHGSASGDTTDFTRGLNETLDRPAVAGPPASGGFETVTGFGPQGAGFAGVGPQMANNGAAAPNYTDLDGVRRQGDVLSSGATSTMLPSNSADRPPIVSRQIRTVAELGTVFRDQPWKTLNFTTAGSADAGLLDAFSIFEPNSVFRSDIAAGKVSLNTRQATSLRAVLAGVATNAFNNTPLITEAQRDNIVTALLAMTATQPMLNKSELVTRLAADPSVTALGNKEAREAVIRALSDVGQTRTWNLMIDVIAQSGRYDATASSLDNFIVQGEKRYWLHVAIDRFTGQVIDQQLEAVYE